MPKNRKWIIVILILVVIIMMNQEGKKETLSGYSSLSSCESNMQEDIDAGEACVGPCVEIDSGISTCIEGCGNAVPNDYYYYHTTSDNCQDKYDAGGSGQCQMDCFYGGVPAPNQVCTANSWRCVDVNTEQQCNSAGTGWNTAQGCGFDEVCNDPPGQCETVLTTCVDSDGGMEYNIQGTVTVGADSYTDICVDNVGFAGSWSVKEFYCSNDQKAEVIKDCKEVFGKFDCLNGKCVECTTDLHCVARYEDGYTCTTNNVCQLTQNTCSDYPNNYGSCSLGGGSTCTADKTAILSGCSDLDSSSAYVYCWTQKTDCATNKVCEVINTQATCVDAPTCIQNSDCNDGNQCTTDTCSGGTCSYTNKADGTSCSGGEGVCQSGYCSLLQKCSTLGGAWQTSSCNSTQTDITSSVTDTSDKGVNNFCCKDVSDGDGDDDKCLAFVETLKDGECKISGVIWMIGVFLVGMITLKMLGKQK